MAVKLESETAGASIEQLSKYLTFMLGSEEYGLEILKVREIIGLMDITKVPRMPVFIRGVINLRGKVIPVISLRLKFGLEAIEDTEETCIIVVDLGEMFMGVVVDKVSEVLDIPAEDIEQTPDFGIEVDTDFIMGVGKSKGKVVMLLDIGKVLTADDAISLRDVGVTGNEADGLQEQEDAPNATPGDN